MQPVCEDAAADVRSYPIMRVAHKGTKKGREISIAIVGSGYAGMTFANLIQTRSKIDITIFEALDAPDVGIIVGNVYIPSAEQVFYKIGLQWKWDQNQHSIPEEELLASLRSRILEEIKYRTRVLDLESRQDGIYLNVIARNKDGHLYHREGPFDFVVAANGVRSMFRRCGIDRVALIGDSRWVQSRWWDLGSRRLRKGADIALRDALELAEKFLFPEADKDDHLILDQFSAGKKHSPFHFTTLCIALLVAMYASSPLFKEYLYLRT